MLNIFKTVVWGQFGASLDMLENAIEQCPNKIWGDKAGFQEYWYMTYHTLFFLDYFMSEKEEGFEPLSPYTLSELDPAGLFPDRVYNKGELLTYLKFGRNKAKARIDGLTEKTLFVRCRFKRPELTVAELMLYTMRHVQHHAAQLNLLLRQKTNSAPNWVGKGKN